MLQVFQNYFKLKHEQSQRSCVAYKQHLIAFSIQFDHKVGLYSAASFTLVRTITLISLSLCSLRFPCWGVACPNPCSKRTTLVPVEIISTKKRIRRETSLSASFPADSHLANSFVLSFVNICFKLCFAFSKSFRFFRSTLRSS